MNQRASHDYSNDEIELLEVFAMLWQEKATVVAIIVFFTLIGGAYAYLTPPTYEIKARLNPRAPVVNELLQNLSFGTSLEVNVDNYVQLVESPEFQEKIYREGHLDVLLEDYSFDASEAVLRAIPRLLYVRAFDGKTAPSIYPYEVLLEARDPSSGEMVLNQILSLVEKELGYQLQDSYEARKVARITELLEKKGVLEVELQARRNDEISRLAEADNLQRAELTEKLRIKTESYFENLSDRIKSLEEAVGIAKALGIVEPVALDRLVRKNETVAANQVFEVVSNSKEDPLYMRGTRILTAELEQLKNRPKDFIPDNEIRMLRDELEALKVNHKVQTLKARISDESFSEELQSIRAELARLKAEQFPSDLLFEFSNGKAISSERPVRPKRLLILALSLCIGVFIGVVGALVRATSKKRKLGQRVF